MTERIIDPKTIKGVRMFMVDNASESGDASGDVYVATAEYITGWMDSTSHYIREVSLDDEDVVEIVDFDGSTKYLGTPINMGPEMDLGDVSTWKYLVSKGVSPWVGNPEDYVAHHAMRIAIANGQLDVVRYIFSICEEKHLKLFDSSVSRSNAVDRLLVTAALNGHLDEVKYLIDEHGAHANIIESWSIPYGPLIAYVAKRGYLDIVRFLVERGANIHAQQDEALVWASGEGNLDVVRFLVERGANIHAQHDAALARAKSGRHEDVVTFLTRA